MASSSNINPVLDNVGGAQPTASVPALLGNEVPDQPTDNHPPTLPDVGRFPDIAAASKPVKNALEDLIRWHEEQLAKKDEIIRQLRQELSQKNGELEQLNDYERKYKEYTETMEMATRDLMELAITRFMKKKEVKDGEFVTIKFEKDKIVFPSSVNLELSLEELSQQATTPSTTPPITK